MKHRPLLSMIAQSEGITAGDLRRKYGLPLGNYLAQALWSFKANGYLLRDSHKKYNVTNAGVTLSKHVTSEDIELYVLEMQEEYPSKPRKKRVAKATTKVTVTTLPSNTSEVLRYLTHMTKDHERLEDINRQYMEALANYFNADISYREK